VEGARNPKGSCISARHFSLFLRLLGANGRESHAGEDEGQEDEGP